MFIITKFSGYFYLLNDYGDILHKEKTLEYMREYVSTEYHYFIDNGFVIEDFSEVVYDPEHDIYSTKKILNEEFLTSPEFEDIRKEFQHFNLWYSEITGKNGVFEILR